MVNTARPMILQLFMVTPAMMKSLRWHFDRKDVQWQVSLPAHYLKTQKALNGKERQLNSAKQHLLDSIPEKAAASLTEMMDSILAMNNIRITFIPTMLSLLLLCGITNTATR